jgi:CheY-like chemotaxis protein
MSEPYSSTILLVEDNEDDVFAMTRALKIARIGNPMQIVTDGEMVKDYLSGTGAYADRAKHPLPFIIFLDLKLPFVNGFELLSWIRKQPELNSLVVVVLTSSAEERDHEQAYAFGARSFLVKPPTAQGLTDVFNSLESYWLARSTGTPLLAG